MRVELNVSRDFRTRVLEITKCTPGYVERHLRHNNQMYGSLVPGQVRLLECFSLFSPDVKCYKHVTHLVL